MHRHTCLCSVVTGVALLAIACSDSGTSSSGQSGGASGSGGSGSGGTSVATGGTSSGGTMSPGGAAGGGTGGAAGSGTGGDAVAGSGGSTVAGCERPTATGGFGAHDTDTIGDQTASSITYTPSNAYFAASAGVTQSAYAYTSTTSDTPAIKVAAGGSLTLTNSKATKSGDTASDNNSNFYGSNAGVLATSSTSASSFSAGNAASLSITNGTITTAASGSNGAFAFGAKANVTLDHVTIATTKDSSRGVDATYGGTVTITNSKIRTQGAHCAALASDRYDQTSAPAINATNVVGTTAGDGSPGIYCTGTFTVDHATLTAAGSEAAAIEGKNSITLTDSVLSGNAKWGVMIYQSMSGDSSQGSGKFSMTNGSLTNNYANGPMFFVCDTTAEVALTNVSMTNKSTVLLAASTAASASTCGISNVNSSWGTLGGTVNFTAKHQTLEGEIKICDAKSSLALTLTGSTLNSTINSGNVSTGGIALTLDACSTWNLTGNSYVTSLAGSGTINKNGYTLTVSGSTSSTLTIK